MNKLHVWPITFSFAIVSAIWMVVTAWGGALGWGASIVELSGTYYYGFAPTFVGGLIGIVWGAVVGGITGWLIAVFYNMFVPSKKK